mgnify:CR=1 FL=1
MWRNKTISIVIATYKEKNTIRQAIEDFIDTGLTDEIIVVNNNAEPGTVEEVSKTTARMVYEPNQGYGYTFRHGIREATGDYIVLFDPDGSFSAKDLERFLVYTDDFPVVFGSRMNRSTHVGKTDMNSLRRYGNVLCAKMIEVLFGAKTMTEIGCTYKLFKRETIRSLEPHFKSFEPLFATELLVLVAKHKIPFVEIPVMYRARVGTSTIVAHWYTWTYWGFRVWWYIVSEWFRWTFIQTKR